MPPVHYVMRVAGSFDWKQSHVRIEALQRPYNTDIRPRARRTGCGSLHLLVDIRIKQTGYEEW